MIPTNRDLKRRKKCSENCEGSDKNLMIKIASTYFKHSREAFFP